MCVFEQGKEKERGAAFEDAPCVTPLWTLLACCFSKQKGPKMIQHKPKATAAHPGAKVRTTNLQTHTLNLPHPIIFHVGP